MVCRREGFSMEYGGGYGNCGNSGGYDNCGSGGGYGGNGSGFALIVVLFILLIIIGASFMNNKSCY